ncbi:KR domain-containing protein, partial [uncultured Shewanella sp.]|uniref:KR domain-containing protein n=1 Tax=uncultured Shewanella sp. TaxID=173975 RepID=UPI0026381CDD
LPELNPEEMAECRTLGDIVSYLNSQLCTNSLEMDSHSPQEEEKIDVKVMTADSLPLSSTISSQIELPSHSEVVLAPLPPLVEQTLNIYPQNACIIIVDDGHNAGALAEKLRLQHLQIAVIRLPEGEPQSPLSSEVESFQLKSQDEVGLRETLAYISHSFSQIAGLVYLQPLSQSVLNDAESLLVLNKKSLRQLKLVFLWAKLLQSELTKEHGNSRYCFMTVSRMDGGFGLTNNAQLNAIELNQGGLSGLCKTMNHEWPDVFCRALDITPEMDAQSVAQAILFELCDQDVSLTEVGVTLLGRFNPVLNTVLDKNEAMRVEKRTSKPVSINSTDIILVTGGAKGVTQTCALALAKKTQAHFILAGRSEYLPLVDRPAWSENTDLDNLQAAAITFMQTQSEKVTPKQIAQLIEPIKNALKIDLALQAFKEVGASAEYVSMDVTDSYSVRTQLSNYTKVSENQSLEPHSCITGVIHGAGVLADNYIQNKSLDEFDRVYDTKVKGLVSIMEVIDPQKLKVLALFSSAAAFYGNKGQSDYAMANEILNKIALQLSVSLSQTKVMSFDWGPWDGGMVNADLRKMFIDRGVDVIPLESGAELFTRQLVSSHHVQLVVGSSMQGSAKKQVPQPLTMTPDSLNDRYQHEEYKDNQGQNGTVQVLSDLEKNTDIKPLTRAIILTRRLNLATLPIVLDHCIGGNPVLPAVFAIQWMREAAISSCGLAFDDTHHVQVQVEDYQLLKGIIFNLFEDQLLKLTLMPDGDGDKYQQALKAELYCNDRPQSSARLIVKTIKALEEDEQPSLMDRSALAFDNENDNVLDASQFYQQGVLFHGPRLQGITAVQHINDTFLLALCQLPLVNARDSGCFTPCYEWGGCQPFAEDLLLQAMLVWARFKYEAASLPTSIGKLLTYQPFQQGEKGVLLLEVIEHSFHQLKANVSLYHQNGELSAVLKGAVVTISDSLNDAFLSNTLITNETLVEAKSYLNSSMSLSSSSQQIQGRESI